MFYRRNKYGNKKTEYKNDYYDSKKESEYAWQLDMEQRGKIIKAWHRQVKIPLDVNGVHICNIVVDFLVDELDGSQSVREVKGHETDDWKIKWKLLQALYGDRYTYRLIK